MGRGNLQEGFVFFEFLPPSLPVRNDLDHHRQVMFEVFMQILGEAHFLILCDSGDGKTWLQIMKITPYLNGEI